MIPIVGILLSFASSALLTNAPDLFSLYEVPSSLVGNHSTESLLPLSTNVSFEPFNYNYLITGDIIGLDLDDDIMSAKVMEIEKKLKERELSAKFGVDLSPNPDVGQEPSLKDIVMHPIPVNLEDVQDYGFGKIRMRAYCQHVQSLRDDCELRKRRKIVSVSVSYIKRKN